MRYSSHKTAGRNIDKNVATQTFFQTLLTSLLFTI